ncbi:protein CutA, chloroplastic-like isoform X2 [Andrographis paniculata]|nr:protein CutA, chloroplastic-like isoform X2 [Andrographis paniculata]
MALRLSSVVSSAVFRRQLPLVGVFCVISFGVANLCSSIPPFSRTGSIFGVQAQESKLHNIRMEASKTTVPSIVVYVTVPSKEAGQKLAASIVKERLAACVNRVPGVESVYEWKGEIQTDTEELLIIKTRESLLDALTQHVKANHEYE